MPDDHGEIRAIVWILRAPSSTEILVDAYVMDGPAVSRPSVIGIRLLQQWLDNGWQIESISSSDVRGRDMVLLVARS